MVATRWVGSEFAARRVRQGVADRQPSVGDLPAVGRSLDQRQIAATVAVEVAGQVARCRPPGSQFDRITLGKGATRGQPLAGDRLAVCAMADLQQVAPAVAVEVGVEPGEIALPALLAGESPAIRQPQFDLHLAAGTARAGEQVGAAIAVVIVQSPVGVATRVAKDRLRQWAVVAAVGGGHGAPGGGDRLAVTVPPELDDVAAQVAVYVAGEEPLRRPRGAERARARRREAAAVVLPGCHLQFALVVVRDVQEVVAAVAAAAGEQRDVPRPRPEGVAADAAAAAAAVADAQPGAGVAAVRVLRRIALHDGQVAEAVAVDVGRQPGGVRQALPGGILGEPSLEGPAVSPPDAEPVAAVAEYFVHAEVGKAIAIAVAEGVVGVGGVGEQRALASLLQALAAGQPGVGGGDAAGGLADLAEVAATVAVDVADQVARTGQPGTEDDRFAAAETTAAGEPRSGNGHAVGAPADLQQVAAAVGVDIGLEQQVRRSGAGRRRATASAGRWRGDDDTRGGGLGVGAAQLRGRRSGGGEWFGGDGQIARQQQPRFERLALQTGLGCCGRGAPVRGGRPAAGGRRGQATAPGLADGVEQWPEWRPLRVQRGLVLPCRPAHGDFPLIATLTASGSQPPRLPPRNTDPGGALRRRCRQRTHGETRRCEPRRQAVSCYAVGGHSRQDVTACQEVLAYPFSFDCSTMTESEPFAGDRDQPARVSAAAAALLPARLRSLIGSESVAAFGRRCGLSESVLRTYLKDGRMPPLDKAAAIGITCSRES
jgi:hypothetical protein